MKLSFKLSFQNNAKKLQKGHSIHIPVTRKSSGNNNQTPDLNLLNNTTEHSSTNNSLNQLNTQEPTDHRQSNNNGLVTNRNHILQRANTMPTVATFRNSEENILMNTSLHAVRIDSFLESTSSSENYSSFVDHNGTVDTSFDDYDDVLEEEVEEVLEERPYSSMKHEVFNHQTSVDSMSSTSSGEIVECSEILLDNSSTSSEELLVASVTAFHKKPLSVEDLLASLDGYIEESSTTGDGTLIANENEDLDTLETLETLSSSTLTQMSSQSSLDIQDLDDDLRDLQESCVDSEGEENMSDKDKVTSSPIENKIHTKPPISPSSKLPPRSPSTKRSPSLRLTLSRIVPPPLDFQQSPTCSDILIPLEEPEFGQMQAGDVLKQSSKFRVRSLSAPPAEIDIIGHSKNIFGGGGLKSPRKKHDLNIEDVLECYFPGDAPDSASLVEDSNHNRLDFKVKDNDLNMCNKSSSFMETSFNTSTSECESNENLQKHLNSAMTNLVSKQNGVKSSVPDHCKKVDIQKRSVLVGPVSCNKELKSENVQYNVLKETTAIQLNEKTNNSVDDLENVINVEETDENFPDDDYSGDCDTLKRKPSPSKSPSKPTSFPQKFTDLQNGHFIDDQSPEMLAIINSASPVLFRRKTANRGREIDKVKGEFQQYSNDSEYNRLSQEESSLFLKGDSVKTWHGVSRKKWKEVYAPAMKSILLLNDDFDNDNSQSSSSISTSNTLLDQMHKKYCAYQYTGRLESPTKGEINTVVPNVKLSPPPADQMQSKSWLVTQYSIPIHSKDNSPESLSSTTAPPIVARSVPNTPTVDRGQHQRIIARRPPIPATAHKVSLTENNVCFLQNCIKI